MVVHSPRPSPKLNVREERTMNRHPIRTAREEIRAGIQQASDTAKTVITIAFTALAVAFLALIAALAGK